MNPERWRQAESLFHRALEVEPAERAAFLAAACNGDVGLQSDVEALLSAHGKAGSFIQEPCCESMLAPDEGEPSKSLTGESIGPYKILREIGRGGMGEVYLAQDRRLGRQVALKLLPAQYAADPEWALRFAREARAASALNHPNIITIYEIEKVAKARFIAAEFIEGQTLRQRLANGRMALGEALNIAVQVAGALAAAHTAGVIHRDIKPENIMIRPDGLVKVLDFGLARIEEPEAAPADTPSHPSMQRAQSLLRNIRNTTHTLPAVGAQTVPGTIMGTIAYMSPEQALGQEIDPRADIFSLGIVLYEMVTGDAPFKGRNAGTILDAIAHQEPAPVTHLQPDLPPALERIVSRALAKDREARYQTAAEMRADLRKLERELGGSTTYADGAQPIRKRAGWLDWRVKTALGVVVALAMAWPWLPRTDGGGKPEPSPWGNARSIKLTAQAGEELFPSLAPDGESFVYEGGAAGSRDIYWQRVGQETPKNLTGDYAGDDTHPAFSPDGQWIAFRSERGGGGIYLMDATGRALRRLTGGGYHPAWSPDGREILCTTENIVSPYNRAVRPRHLWAVNVTTGEKRLITTADVAQPRWSPHGYRIAYWGSRPGAQRDIWTMRPDGGEPLAVTDDAALDWNPVWSPDGRYLYFASDRAGSMNLWRVAIDEQSGRVLSAPELVPTPSAYSQHIAFSGDGRRLAHAQVNARKNVQRIAFDPERGMVVGRPIWITQGSRWVVEPHLSPDGRWLVCSSLGEKQEDLFLIRSDGAGERIPLTQDAYKDRFPCWSPDGKQIAFYSNRSGTWEIWAINAEDRKLRQLTFTSGADAFFPIWSPDGARLAYTGRNGSASVIDVTRPWAEQTPQPVFSPTAPQAVFWPTVWSPDGRKLVGGWRRNRDDALSGLAIYSFESRQFERLTDFGRGNPVWLKDNRRLLFRHEGKVFLVDSRTKKVHEVFSAAPHKIGRFTLSRDNRLLYFDLEETEADIWMLDLDEEQQASGHGASAKSR